MIEEVLRRCSFASVRKSTDRHHVEHVGDLCLRLIPAYMPSLLNVICATSMRWVSVRWYYDRLPNFLISTCILVGSNDGVAVLNRVSPFDATNRVAWIIASRRA